MKRKFFRIISLVLTLIAASSLLLGCARSGSTPTTQQTTTVQRGNITTLINATGNLAFSTRQDLAFGQSGQVALLAVKVGDNITQGQVLAELDTTDLEQAVDSANLSVQSARISLTVAQNAQSNIRDQELAVQSAQVSLQVAQNAQSSIASAQISLDTASNSLVKISYPYNYSTFAFDVPAAIAAIHDARLKLQLASADLQPGSTINYGEALIKFNQALDSLTTAEQRLAKGVNPDLFVKDVTSGNATTAYIGSNPWNTTDYWTLRAAQLAVASAQQTVDNAKNSYKTGLDTANINLAKAQQALSETKNSYQTSLAQANVNLTSTQNNLAKAQRNLAEAAISAPFTGIVTAVNISAGQLVGSGQVAISIADPAKLEANVMVNEVDIPWVTTQSRATLQVDAVSAIDLPAKVTSIAPTATISSGVVNYTVTIEVQSSTITTPTSANQTGQSTQGRTTPGQSGQARTGSRALQAGTPSSITLRQGLSVTANIVREQRTGVLLVSARAITQQGSNSYVSVVKSDTTTEQRLVQTGLTDGQNTEITSGLSEGEKVLSAPRPTPTTTPAGGSSPFRPGGGIRIGG